MIRRALGVIAVLWTLPVAAIELVIGYPMPLWAYLVVVPLLAGALPAGPAEKRGQGLRVFVAGVGVLAALYLVPWNSRKSFMAEFADLEVGMSEAEVRQALANYRERRNLPDWATFRIAQEGRDRGVEGRADKVVAFRHATGGRFGSDLGIVWFEEDRVLAFEFSPD